MEYFQPLLESTKLDTDGHDERLRQNATKGLLQEESGFFQSCQHGIQLFSRPLRVLINAEEHTALFQNLKKLVAMTDFRLEKLHSSASASAPSANPRQDGFIDTPGKTFHSMLELFLSSFESYCMKFNEARKIMERLLHGNSNFTAYVGECLKNDEENDIEVFISRPVEHFDRLIEILRRILLLTPETHHDYDDLSVVVKAAFKALDRVITGYLQNCKNKFILRHFIHRFFLLDP